MCYCLLVWLVGRFGKLFSPFFFFQVLLSDTADLQQSDSVSNYDAEVCGVVPLVDRLSVTALLLLRTWLTMLIISVALLKKKVGETFHLRNRTKKTLILARKVLFTNFFWCNILLKNPVLWNWNVGVRDNAGGVGTLRRAG